MRAKRTFLYLAVAGLFLAAGCGRTKFDQQREEARARWNESRAAMAVRLGQGCYDRGQFDRAQKHIEDVLKSENLPAPLLVLAARLAAEKGDFDEARRYAENARVADPRSAEACYVLGIIEQTLGHNDQAMAEFAEAARLGPDDPKYILAETEMLVAAGRADGAAVRLRAAADRMPGQAEVHVAFGDVRSLLGQDAEAVADYRRALRVGADAAGLNERLATALFRSGAYAEAEPMLDELAQAKAPAEPDWLLRMRVDCLLALGRPDDARSLCRRRAETAPGAVQVALAKCDVLENRLPSARKSLEAALAADPRDAEANALMGYVLVAQGRTDEARPHLKAALADPRCEGRRTVERLLARAEGRPTAEPDSAAPSATPRAAGRDEGPYTVARPVRPL
jgi:tetratricopeptide (TPR) repeat protein